MGRLSITFSNQNKYFLKVLSILFVLLFVFCLSGCFGNEDKSEQYKNKIVSELQMKESILAKDIFDFEWDRAFAISEGYIDGRAFAEKYGLDISIEKMPEWNNDLGRRIVFVDSDGKFVFLFYFWLSKEFYLAEDGIIIHPDTMIRKSDKCKSDELCVEFVVKPEDHLEPVSISNY